MTLIPQPEWMNWPETKVLVQAFASKPGSLQFVGGCVRDALLGRAVHDVDAATTHLPQQVMDLLKASSIACIPTGIDHGTVTAVIAGKHFEITTLRKDIATDGRHAVVAYTDDWKADAARRDFTMNALYLSPVGELHDYFSGAEDAKAGRVRFIGKAEARIKEDYLRILRFFRFHAHYGKGNPDADALKACTELAPGMTALSGERLWQEWNKLLSAPSSTAVLEYIHQRHLWPYMLGAAIKNTALVAGLERSGAPDPQLKLAALLLATDTPLKVCATVSTRLKLSHAITKHLQTLLAPEKEITAATPLAKQKQFIRKLGKELFCELVMLGQAKDGNHAAYAPMLQLAKEWNIPVFPVSGDDLLALGMKEGTDLGKALKELEQFWEENNYAPTKEALLKRAKS